MTTPLLTTLLACFLAAGAAAAPRDGLLLDANGQPLAGARVLVLGHGRPATTGRDGRFHLPATPEPPFRVLVTGSDGIAFPPIHVDTLPESGPLTLTLPPAYTADVTVVSGVVPDLEVPPASATTLVGAGDLERRAPTRLADVLEAVPGTSTVDEGHSVVPAVRGLARGRTLVVLDEGRVTTERRAGPSASFLDPDSLAEVEVARGPAGVAYGSDAMGGVIRARSRWARPLTPPSLRLRATTASAAPGVELSGEGTHNVGPGGLLVGGHYRTFDDYRGPHGVVPVTGAEDRGGRIGYEQAALGGTLRVAVRADAARDVGKPDRRAPGVRTLYPREDSTRLHAAFERPEAGPFALLSASAFVGNYRLVTDRTTESADGRLDFARSDIAARDYGARIQVERTLRAGRAFLGADGNGRFGLEARGATRTLRADGEILAARDETAIADARKDTLGLFAGAERNFGRVRATAGARVDHARSRNRGGYFGDATTARSEASGFLSGSLAIDATTELSLQAARGFRDPSLSDRFFRGISGRGFVTGNPALDAETSLQFDSALRHARGPLVLSLFGYRYRIDDRVERYRDGTDFFFRNGTSALLSGAEIEATVELSATLRLDLAGAVERGETEAGDPLDDIPPATALATLRGDPRDGHWWWFVRVRTQGQDDQAGPTEVTTPAWATLDAALGLRVAPGLEAELRARNVLDAARPGSADENSPLAPGRSLGASLRLRR